MHAHIQDESLFVENLSIPQPLKIIEHAYLLKYNFKDCLKKTNKFFETDNFETDPAQMWVPGG